MFFDKPVKEDSPTEGIFLRISNSADARPAPVEGAFLEIFEN